MRPYVQVLGERVLDKLFVGGLVCLVGLLAVAFDDVVDDRVDDDVAVDLREALDVVGVRLVVVREQGDRLDVGRQGERPVELLELVDVGVREAAVGDVVQEVDELGVGLAEDPAENDKLRDPHRPPLALERPVSRRVAGLPHGGELVEVACPSRPAPLHM